MPSITLAQSRASEALRTCGIPALRNLRLEETDAVVIIYGVVNSYYQKQLAQETVMPLVGERKLLNRVIVDRVETLV